MNNVKFIKKTSEFEYKTPKGKNTFYQICQFKNPDTNNYQTRKTIFGENEKIIATFEKEYSYEVLQNFMKSKNTVKFKMYPVHFVKYIDLPNGATCLEIRSELLNNNVIEYDFSPIN